MRILAFSDWRVHDMAFIDEAVALVGEVDAILYAGDDTLRFARPSAEKVLEFEAARQLSAYRFVPRDRENVAGVHWGGSCGIAVRFRGETKRDAIAEVRRLEDAIARRGAPGPKQSVPLWRLIQRFGTGTRLRDALLKSFRFYRSDGVGVFLEDASESVNHFERIGAQTTFGMGAVIGNDCFPSDCVVLNGKRIRDLHRNPWQLGNVGIIGLEGVPHRGMGHVRYSEREADTHLTTASAGFSKQTALIVVSHAPPAGVLDFSIRYGCDHVGSKALLRFVHRERPRVVVCGHSHLSGGRVQMVRETMVVNVANHDSQQSLARLALIEVGRQVSIRWIVPQRESVRALDGCGPIWEERLRSCGYARHAQLRAVSPQALHEHVRVPVATARRWVLHAEAIATGRFVPLTNREEKFPEECIFYDIETLPFGGPQEQVWLIGYRIGRSGKVRQLLARRRRDEKRILREFLDVLRAHPTIPIACWSGSANFDHAYVRRRLDVLLRRRLREFEAHPQWNVLAFIKRHAVPPAAGFGLKEIARSLGLIHGEGLDGLAAAIAYEDWLRTRRRPDWKALLAYNAEDVELMTKALEAFERDRPAQPSEALFAG